MTQSFWLQDAGNRPARLALETSEDADVAILGAGYTGLWTAWYLRQRDPAMKVVLCEAEYAGFGASGRNGGWCAAGLGLSPAGLARRWSSAVARRTVAVMRETVDEVGRACAGAGIDAGFRKTGVLRIARGPHEVASVDAAWRESANIGVADGLQRLDADALAQRVRVNQGHAALFDPHAAAVHPGRLVCGLAAAVERAGATIYEHTPVTSVQTGAAPMLRTPHGDVRAQTVVLAGEAWMSGLPGMRRAVLPLYSLIVLTEPLSDCQWAKIGWQGGELLSSRRYTVDYLSRTPDGRILFGGRGAPYHFGSSIEPEHDHHEPTHALLREQLLDWFPSLAGIRFTHAWGGPIGMPRDWLPTFRHNPRTGLAGAWGYTGQGVATANLAGRVLADLITTGHTPMADLPMVNHHSRPWEPEPLRWLATRAMQRGLERIDARAQRTGRAPSGRTLTERLFRH